MRYARFLILLTWIGLFLVLVWLFASIKRWETAMTCLAIALILAFNAPQSWHLARTRK